MFVCLFYEHELYVKLYLQKRGEGREDGAMCNKRGRMKMRIEDGGWIQNVQQCSIEREVFIHRSCEPMHAGRNLI